MTQIPIFTSERQSVMQAKSDYADILGIKRSSIRIERYKGHYSPTSCRCSCGETLCIELRPKGIDFERLLKAVGGRGAYWYGICESCGKKY